jgi:hypothetical protein
MEGRNTSSGLVICILVLIGAGLFMTLSFNGGFFFFTPYIPAVIIFVICIIAIGAASNHKSKQSKNEPYPYYYHYQNQQRINHQQLPVPTENPYKVKQIQVIDDTPKVEEESSSEKISEPKAQFCMFCGVNIDRDAVFCHQCGTKLK